VWLLHAGTDAFDGPVACSK